MDNDFSVSLNRNFSCIVQILPYHWALYGESKSLLKKVGYLLIQLNTLRTTNTILLTELH